MRQHTTCYETTTGERTRQTCLGYNCGYSLSSIYATRAVADDVRCRSTWTFLVCAPAHLVLTHRPHPDRALISAALSPGGHSLTYCAPSPCAATLCVPFFSLFGDSVWFLCLGAASGANCTSPSMSGVVPFPGVMTIFIVQLSVFAPILLASQHIFLRGLISPFGPCFISFLI